MRVFIVTTDDKTRDGNDFTGTDIAQAVMNAQLFTGVRVRTSWQAMGTLAEPGTALEPLSFYTDSDGYPWVEFGDGSMACLEGAVARRLRDKYPLVPRDKAEAEFGPLCPLQPAPGSQE